MNQLYFIVQQTMFFSIPLLVVALGGMFSERSGVINIALEGTMIIGAFTGILFINTFQGTLPGHPVLFLALIIAALSGMALATLHAFAAIHMKANQIISGTALNMFAPALAIYIARMLRTIQQIPFINQFRIERVPLLGDLPLIGPMLFQRSYFTTYLGFVLLCLSWLVLYRTPFGMRLRACGEHPQAANSVGINVYRLRYAGVIISGALAGIGGLVFIIPTSTEFASTVSGYGFLALAVLIFGQWRPWRILGAAFFFGTMMTIGSSWSGIPFLRDLGLPGVFYKSIPYVATLVALAFSSKSSMAPRSGGIPYDKGSR